MKRASRSQPDPVPRPAVAEWSPPRGQTRPHRRRCRWWSGVAGGLVAGLSALAQDAIRFSTPERPGPAGFSCSLTAPPGLKVRLEQSTNLRQWSPFQTLLATGTNRFTDWIDPQAGTRIYRAVAVPDPNALTGDHLPTSDGDLVIHPVNHASLLLRWKQRTIYVDPVGGATAYADLPRADLILITHGHGDHFHAATLTAVSHPETLLVAPAAVSSSLSATLRARTAALANGATTNLLEIQIEAVPAYNANHPKGVGNGYVLALADRRIYLSGDTGDIPETRALRDIDVAFLCMNLPFTMSVTQAAAVARAFAPRILYPYHFRNQDGSFANLETLRHEIGEAAPIEVRVRDWY